MGTQQFCLKWNNHQTNMLAVFDQLLQNEAFVDVTLACEGISLKAHKMVLSACSPYFQALFIENPCKHPIVILNSIRYSDLKAIVDFMYKGEVNVSQEQLSALLKTAETLKVKGLAEVTNQTAGIHGSGQVASGGDGSASHPPSSARSTATPPPVQRSSTGSPPPKRKKLRNGASAGSPQQQSNSAGSQSTSSNAAKLNNSEKTTTAAAVNDSAGGGRSHVSSGLDASLDGHSDHDSQRSNDASLPQTLTLSSGAVPSTSQHTDSDVPPEPELIIGSPEASDDKSLLANLTTEMGYDSAGQHESSSKDHQQSILPMSLGAFSGADMSLHPSHSLSIVPSTSGSQNTPPESVSIVVVKTEVDKSCGGGGDVCGFEGNSLREQLLPPEVVWQARLQCENSMRKMATKLSQRLFTAQERVACNVYAAGSRPGLDKRRMEYLRRTVLADFNVEPEHEQEAWSQCVVAINCHCRYLRWKLHHDMGSLN